MYQIDAVSPARKPPRTLLAHAACVAAVWRWCYSRTYPAWAFVAKLPREQLLASGVTNVRDSSESVFYQHLESHNDSIFQISCVLLLSCWGSIMAPCWLEYTFFSPAPNQPNPVSLLLSLFLSLSLSVSLSLAPSIRPSTRWCHLWWRCQRMNLRRRRGRIRSSDKWTSIMMVRGGNGIVEGMNMLQRGRASDDWRMSVWRSVADNLWNVPILLEERKLSENLWLRIWVFSVFVWCPCHAQHLAHPSWDYRML